MKVELISYTELGEKACGVAAKTCVAYEMPNMDDDNSKSLMHALASGHESIAEHWSATFAIEGISRACLAQLSRHRLMSLSVQSQRYVRMDGFEYVTPPSIKNHEKTWDEDGKTDVAKWYTNAMEALSELYASLITAGIPIEDARMILPNAVCTNVVLTVNARELKHIAALRMCGRAQAEIRELVTKMVELAQKVAPLLFKGVGATCVQTGRCPEKNPCGRIIKYEQS